MLAKYWKRILLIILIVACIISIIVKLTKVISFNSAIENIKSKMSISQKEK